MDRELQQLIADLKQLPREVDREFRVALRKAADPIVADAKDRARWSNRIPGAIGTRTRITGRGITVAIRVNAKRAPHARPHEHKGKPGNFRHPVFADAENETRGQWKWVPQRARPFLAPAAQANIEHASRQVMDVIDTAVRRRGWR